MSTPISPESELETTSQRTKRQTDRPKILEERRRFKRMDVSLNGRFMVENTYLNGEVVRLAESLGQQAPVNRMLIQLIREAEQGGRRDWSGDELLAVLRRAATAAP